MGGIDWLLRKTGLFRWTQPANPSHLHEDQSSLSVDPHSATSSFSSPSETGSETEPLTIYHEDHQYAMEALTRKKTWITVKDLQFHANGVFSNVYRGRLTHPEEREIVMKKSFPTSNMRNPEMLLMGAMRLSNPHNIMPLLYTYQRKHEACTCQVIVLPFMPQSLDQLIGKLDEIDTKLYAWQLFNGLHFLEINSIAHRDIKPVNILIDHEKGELLIGDFGNAKVMEEGRPSTPYQVTRFYRAPELLHGVCEYSSMVDVWSAGCVMGEMIKGRILFPGANTAHQISLIHESLDAPSQADLIDMGVIEISTDLMTTKAEKSRSLRKHMPSASEDTILFISLVLQYSPSARLHGEQALSHPYFDQIHQSDGVRWNGRPTAPSLKRQKGAATRYYDYKKVIASNRGKTTPSIPTPVRTPVRNSSVL